MNPESPWFLLATTLAIITVASLGAEALSALTRRRCSAATRHDIHLVALILTLLSPLMALGVSRSGLILLALPTVGRPPEPMPQLVEQPVERPLPPITERQVESTPVPRPMLVERPEPARVEPAGQPPLAPPVVVISRPTRSFDPIAALIATWAAGSLILLARLLHGLLALRSLRRRARPIARQVLDQVRPLMGSAPLPPILEASGVSGPLAGGWLRPVIVLPEGMAERLDRSSLRDVLIHECAHVQRRDALVGLLQRVASALFWPQPLVYRLNLRLSRLREEACDDQVVQDGDAISYARTLLLLAEAMRGRRSSTAMVGLFDARWKLEDRVARILQPGRMPMRELSRPIKFAMATTLTLASVAVAAIRPAREEVRPKFEITPQTVIHGQVVDEAGAPVSGSLVNVTWLRKLAEDARTDPQGRFTLTLAGPIRNSETVRASFDQGVRLGIAEFHEPIRSKPDPLRVVLKPARAITVKVVDGQGAIVPGAAVEVNPGSSGPYDQGLTDAQGVARFALPLDAEVETVVGVKDGVGFDYFENYRSWPSRHRDPLPAEVTLVLDGAQAASVKVVDTQNRPVAGVEVYPRLIRKPGKLADLNSGPSILQATTDQDGIARFLWFPRRLERGATLQIAPWNDHCDDLPTIYPGAQLTPIVIIHNVKIAGKVTHPDGSPARNVLIQAEGRGRTSQYARLLARTGEDGTYSLLVPPGQVYILALLDADLAARPLTGIVVREGDPRDGLDFRVVEGAHFRARVVAAPGGKPVAGYDFRVTVLGDEIAEKFLPFHSNQARQDLFSWTKTDAEGRVDFRLGPGEYILFDSESLHVDQPVEIFREYQHNPVEDSPQSTLTGVVIDTTGAGNRPVAGALVQFSPSKPGRTIEARADAMGKFVIESEATIGQYYARNRDGTIAGFRVLPEDGKPATIPLAPAATASGRVVDSDGKPVAGRSVQLSVWTWERNRSSRATMFLHTTTDADGHYAFAGLVPGTRCEAMVNHFVTRDGSGTLSIEKFSVRGTDAIPLPDLMVPVSLPPEPAAKVGPGFGAADVIGANPMPYLINRAEVEALIKAVGRDPVTPALVDQVVVLTRPQSRWVTELDSIQRRLTDPAFLARADRVALEVLGRRAGVADLVDLAINFHVGNDDTQIKEVFQTSSAAPRRSRPLRGTVLDATTGRPIPGAFVFGTFASARTDAQGAFVIDDGTRRVRGALGSNGRLWVEAEGYALVEVALPRDESQPCQVQLLPEAPIVGQVVDRAGKPVAGAVVWSMANHSLFESGLNPSRQKTDSYGFPLTARTDANGRFAFRGMPPGVALKWFDVRHPRYRLIVPSSRDKLEAGASNRLVVELGCVVKGEVVDEAGQAVAGALVQIRAEGKNQAQWSASTSADGHYEFGNVAPGRWELAVEPERHAPKVMTVVALASQPAINQVVVEPGGTIGGKVIDGDGKPIAGAAVGWASPVPSDGWPRGEAKWNRITRTAADGTFRLGPLAAGDYRFTVSQPPSTNLEVVGKVNQTDLVIKFNP